VIEFRFVLMTIGIAVASVGVDSWGQNCQPVHISSFQARQKLDFEMIFR